jgi:hypothetical protein
MSLVLKRSEINLECKFTGENIECSRIFNKDPLGWIIHNSYTDEVIDWGSGHNHSIFWIDGYGGWIRALQTKETQR